MDFRLRDIQGAFFRRSFPLSWHLIVLVLAAMLPLVVFSYIVVQELGRQHRKASERRLVSAVREMSASIDQEIEGTLRTLRALAVSEELKRDNLEKFHADLVKAKGTQPSWATILLHSGQGDILISANRPFGTKLEAPVDPKSVRKVVESAQSSIGKVVRGPEGSKLAGRFIFAVRVPVFRGEEIPYTLSAVIAVDSLQSIVARSSLDEWTRSIVDSEGTIAARSRNPEEFVGKAARDQFLAYTSLANEGFKRDRTIDGQEVYVAYHRSLSTQWTGAIVIPVDAIEAPAWNSMLLVGSVGIILLAAFGAVTFLYSKRLARSIRSAGLAADALARGEVPQLHRSRVREVEQLRRALNDASDLLHLRERERNENLAKANSARIEAESANKAKSDFLANMSHEIRTPLGAIMGFAELSRDPGLSEGERREFLASILRNGKLLTQLISDILDLSKVESGKLVLEKVNCSLPGLLADVMELFEQDARRKGLVLKLTIDGAVPERIETDPTKLRQILINLIGNAVKFTKQGTVRVLVRASRAEREAWCIEFIVEDTGCGIAPEHLGKLFKPFSQADSSVTRQYGGTGLGLMLSRRLAQALGGNVEILRSAANQGSTFRLRVRSELDANPVALSTIKQPRSKPVRESRPIGIALAGTTILLVDDSPDNQILIARILKREGAEVDIANDGLEGLQMALRKDYDVVLMDLQMPVKSGFEAAAELRNMGYRSPIIAVTAAALKEERERALEAGLDDYLTKPIVPSSLISKVVEYTKAARIANAERPEPEGQKNLGLQEDLVRPAVIGELPRIMRSPNSVV